MGQGLRVALDFIHWQLICPLTVIKLAVIMLFLLLLDAIVNKIPNQVYLELVDSGIHGSLAYSGIFGIACHLLFVSLIQKCKSSQSTDSFFLGSPFIHKSPFIIVSIKFIVADFSCPKLYCHKY